MPYDTVSEILVSVSYMASVIGLAVIWQRFLRSWLIVLLATTCLLESAIYLFVALAPFNFVYQYKIFLLELAALWQSSVFLGILVWVRFKYTPFLSLIFRNKEQ